MNEKLTELNGKLALQEGAASVNKWTRCKRLPPGGVELNYWHAGGKRFVWWAKRHRLCKTEPVNESGSLLAVANQKRRVAFALNSMKNDSQLAVMIDSKTSVLFAVFSPSDSWAGQVAPLDGAPHHSTHRRSHSFVTIRGNGRWRGRVMFAAWLIVHLFQFEFVRIPRTSERTYGTEEVPSH